MVSIVGLLVALFSLQVESFTVQATTHHQQGPLSFQGCSIPPISFKRSRIGRLFPLKLSESKEPIVSEKSSEIRHANQIVVSSEIELPFSAEVAFDAFSDLPRQPTWSPWLSSVKEIQSPPMKSDGAPVTRWSMKYMGVGISWDSVSTQLDRPSVIGWKSIRGLRNFGQVEFESLGPEKTNMKLTLTFVTPRFMVRFMGGEHGRVAQLVEKRMLQNSLERFKTIVMENDLVRERSRESAHVVK